MRTAWLALVLALLARPAHADPRIGDPAPALELAAAVPPAPGTVALRKDRVTIVDFAATWCGPCHEAQSRLYALMGTLPPGQVELLIVDVGEPVETVRRFFTSQALPPDTQVLLDPDGAASARWGRHRFPTTFIVARAGVIRFINRGYGPGYADRIAARVRQALARP